MKKYYIVSSDFRFYPDKNDEILLITYNHHIWSEIQCSGKDYNCKNLNETILTRNKFTDATIYTFNKYEMYTDKLSNRLNLLHNEKFNVQFWKKALGLGFKRYITLMHKAFVEFQNFDPYEHSIEYLLDEQSYYTPKDFEELRRLLQHTDFGREQLFSLFIHYFHPELFKKIKKKTLNYPINIFTNDPLTYKVKCKQEIKKILHFLKNKINPIKVGIHHSYFLPEYLKTLTQSKSINTLSIEQSKNSSNVKRNLEQVDLVPTLSTTDDFDQFFIFSLKWLFPSFFLEDFQKHKTHYSNELSKYPKLTHMICEAWIGQTHDTFLLALAKNRGIQHIYNEHNTLFHPFLGNNVTLIVNLVDTYYTLGWLPYNSINNIEKGASLFFPPVASEQKKNQILYIDVAVFAYLEEYITKYSESEEFAIEYFAFIKSFFNTFKKPKTADFIYRAYPKNEEYLNWKVYDNLTVLQDFIPNYTKFDNYELTSRAMMTQSRLVIITYTNTAYLESLILNIPTIFFWNSRIAFLDEHFLDFFDDLISVGICQTDPAQAADFINNLGDDIEMWWESTKVQNAKTKFLSANIGDPKNAIQFYLDLTKEQ